MQWLTDAGLGLDHDVLWLTPTEPSWVDAGQRLVGEVTALLGDSVRGVEQIGSSSVPGLLAKPIIDIAVGLGPDQDRTPIHDLLLDAGWIHRGDAGDHGGHVYVLESQPGRRVAHLHGVAHEGDQWRNYLLLRDLLHRSSGARATYEAKKRELAALCGDDRMAYTDGKTDVVHALLALARAADESS